MKDMLYSRRHQFSIRKLTVGVCSVMIGASLLLPDTAFAETTAQSSVAEEFVGEDETSVEDETTSPEATAPVTTTETESSQPADYSKVREAIQRATTLLATGNLANYTESSVQAVYAAILSVEMDLPASRQAEVDAFVSKIDAAIAGLKSQVSTPASDSNNLTESDSSWVDDETDTTETTAPTPAPTTPTGPADYTKVKEAIKRASALLTTNNLSKYTESSVQAVYAAIGAVVPDKPASQQAEVDAYATKIDAALAGLTPKVEATTSLSDPASSDSSWVDDDDSSSDTNAPADYSKVQAASDKATALLAPENVDKYTESSVEAVYAAILAVQMNKLAGQQSEVDAYALAIETAIASLKLKNTAVEAPPVTATTKPMTVFSLDAGRKYFSLETLKQAVDSLDKLGFTDFHLILGNDGLRFFLDDMSLNVDGTSYSSEAVKEALTKGNLAYEKTQRSNDKGQALTQAEMDELVAYIHSKQLRLIPTINSPGHMDAIVTAIGELGVADAKFSHDGKTSATTLNLNNATAVSISKAMVDKYAAYFSGKAEIFNIGLDEYANDVTRPKLGFKTLQERGEYGKFVTYANDLAAIVKKHNLRPMAFNDGIYHDNDVASGTFDKDIIVSYWTAGFEVEGVRYNVATPKFLHDKGHEIMNTNDDWYYIIGRNTSRSGWYNLEQGKGGIQRTAYHKIQGDATGEVPVIGAMVAVWADAPRNAYNQAMVDQLLTAFTEKNPTIFKADYKQVKKLVDLIPTDTSNLPADYVEGIKQFVVSIDWEKSKDKQAEVNAYVDVLKKAVLPLLSEVPTEYLDLKIFSLDAGRKYFASDTIKEVIDRLSQTGFTDLHLLLGNDGLRLQLDDMTITANDKTYTSEQVKTAITNGNNHYYNDPNGNSLTQAEMANILAYAKDKNIRVIPTINSPGHMDAILDAMVELGIENPKFVYKNKTSSRTIDLDNTAAVDFTKALIKKYVDFFSGKVEIFNIGLDEYANDATDAKGWQVLQSTGKYSKFIDYTNDLAGIVKAAGLKPMAFNDGIYYNSKTNFGTFDKDLIISYWTVGWNGYNVAKPDFLVNKGHHLINTNDAWYYVLGNDTTGGYNLASALTRIESTPFNQLPGSKAGSVPSIGSMVAIWADTPSANFEYDKFNQLVTAFADKNATYLGANYQELLALARTIPEDLLSGKYTDSSAKALEHAIRSIDWDKKRAEQADVDAYVPILRQALANLKLKPVPVSLDDLKPEEKLPQKDAPTDWHQVNHYNETDKTINFDQNWRFNLGDISGAADKSFDASSWKNLDLPHDFSLIQDYTASGEAESGYKPGGVGWYRKSFTIGEEAAKGRVNLQFDGAYMETEVFINGTSLGTHTNGYTPFSFDLTDYLKVGEENLIAVKVTNPVPSSRWYSGSGIYRSVNLNFAPNVHLADYGVSVQTPDLKETYNQATGSTIKVKATVANQGTETANVTLKASLYERLSDGSLGDKMAESALTPISSIEAGQETDLTTDFKLVTPKLWSLDTPNLYILRTEVFQNGQQLQSKDQEMGFRYTEFDKDTGFKLNGKAMKLQGVSMHHDQGSLGARAYYDAVERQFEILKDMGVNAVRVTHNPSSRVMKDIANRKGMLLIDEAFDTWEYAKNENTNDYARFFNRQIGSMAEHLNGAKVDQTWAEYHVKQMVKSGLNDPSIIMWSTGNEVLEGIGGRDTSGYPQVINRLIDWIREIDSTRPATLGDNYLKHKNATSVAMANALLAKNGIVGYNYADGSQYDAGHALNPNWIIYGSETASSVNSRGVYNVKGNTKRSDKQLTSYDQSKVNWGHFASEAWYDVIKRDFVAGEFVWTGFDYLGEPTPWNNTGTGATEGWPSAKSSYFGIVDTAGFPKDSYYFYRSQWNQKDTTLHVLPVWEESVISKDRQNRVEVVVYSNADKVKLVHIDPNGKETDLGTKTFTNKTTDAGYTYKIFEGEGKQRTEHKNLYLTWNVTYAPGTIKAIALNANDEVIADTVGRHTITGFTQPAKLATKVTKQASTVDSHNLAYVEIDVQDANGNLVTNAANRVTVTVDGPAELVAMDNGNAVDHQSYQDGNRQAFAGKVVAILKMTGETGTVRVTASADGLTSSSQEFNVQAKETKDPSVVDAYKFSKTIYIKKGAELKLPETVIVRYQDGHEEERAVTFDQDTIAEKLAAGGNFVARGRVAGLSREAEVVVAVIDQVAAIKNISRAVEVGHVPSLPTTVQAYMPDGTLLSATFPVRWGMPEDSVFDTEGLVTIQGLANVLGDAKSVTATVRVATKSITINQNIAPNAARLTQDIPENLQSDTLNAIKDLGLTVDPNLSGNPVNPTIWSNYKSAQAGNTHATLTFEYDTAQNIAQVVAYYHKDNWSLRLPKSVSFAYNLGSGSEDQAISYTASAPVLENGLTKIIYNLAKPVPAVVFKMTVENSDEALTGRKTSVGLAELKLMSALERFTEYSDASLTNVRIGDRNYSGNKVTTNMRVPDTGAVLATNTNSNVGITILPAKEGVVKIFTESEDKTKSLAYTINIVPESPQTLENHRYIPRDEVTMVAGSVENRPSELVTNANDLDLATHWHSAWSGTDVTNLWVTLDTGKERQLDGLAYMQRQDTSPNGKVVGYQVYVSPDNAKWTLVKSGEFTNTNDWQEVSFTPTQGRYIKLQAISTLGDAGSANRYMSASELRARESVIVTLRDDHISLSEISLPFSDGAVTPKPVVTVAGLVLEEGTDYTLTYSDNIGNQSQDVVATVTIEGKGSYQGQVSKYFTIRSAQSEHYTPTYEDKTTTAGESLILPVIGNIPVSTQFSLESGSDASIAVDPISGTVTVTVPASVATDSVIAGQVRVTYSDGTSDLVPVRVTIVDTPSTPANPKLPTSTEVTVNEEWVDELYPVAEEPAVVEEWLDELYPVADEPAMIEEWVDELYPIAEEPAVVEEWIDDLYPVAEAPAVVEEWVDELYPVAEEPAVVEEWLDELYPVADEPAMIEEW
ncbi:family 20 glycosylhydrolase, partial [Streptococcus caprae]